MFIYFLSLLVNMLDQAGHKISKASRHLQANPEFNNKYEFIVRFTNCQKLFDTMEHTIFTNGMVKSI